MAQLRRPFRGAVWKPEVDHVANLVLPLVVYGTLGLTLLVSSLLAARHRVAYRLGIGTVSVLWVLAGALVNLLAASPARTNRVSPTPGSRRLSGPPGNRWSCRTRPCSSVC